MTELEKLRAAITAYNAAEINEVITEHSLTWIAEQKITYLAGGIRIRALAVDPTGRHWCDGALVVESLNDSPGMTECHLQGLSADDECIDLMQYREHAGLWNALLVPVAVFDRDLGDQVPHRMPDGQWARTWCDMPHRTDAQELAWIAHGGTPLAEFGSR